MRTAAPRRRGRWDRQCRGLRGGAGGRGGAAVAGRRGRGRDDAGPPWWTNLHDTPTERVQREGGVDRTPHMRRAPRFAPVARTGAICRSSRAPALTSPAASGLNCRRARRWRNRLTRCPQKALSFGTCGFESHPPHYPSMDDFKRSRAGAEATNRAGYNPAGAPPRSGLPARRSSPARTPASRRRSAAPERESAAA